MSENALVPRDLVGGPLITSESFDSVVASGDYLPRLQLFGSKSDACAEGKIGIGHYGLVKDGVITDLGEEIDIVIVTWRPKAIKADGDTLIIEYHPNIDENGKVTNSVFKNIMDLSNVRDSGCMYGPEFLVWVPSAGKFATYHMNSKTSRREARNMEPLIGHGATLKCRLITQGPYKWHGPVVIPCSTPLDIPPEEELREQWTKFQNPPQNETEVVETDEEERAR